MKKILFVSDTIKTINLYRSELIALLNEKNFRVNKCSIKNPIHLFIILFNKNIISSNMRSNFICLLFFWKRKILIINGIGSMKNRKILFFIFFFLIKINFKSIFIFHNYRDFNFFKRIKKLNIYWIPGSGGRNFELARSKRNNIGIFTRKNKLKYQKNEIIFLANNIKNRNINIYGCEEKNFKNHKNISVLGWQEPIKFFVKNSTVFHPYGYNDGFPHTLSDSIVSGCNIIVHQKDYINFALNKYTISKRKIFKNYFYISNKKIDKLKKEINTKNINYKYLEVINLLSI